MLLIERFISGVKVLISTYWNVNTIQSEASEKKVNGFNLNLLECK